MKLGIPVMQKRGMTFLEVIIVVTFFGILTALVTPKLVTSLESYKLDVTAKNLAQDLRNAQSHAVETNSYTKLAFYVLADTYYVELSGKKDWTILPEGIIISSTTFQPVSLPTAGYTNLGSPSGGGGTVVLKNKYGDKVYVITTPVNGRVRISKSPPEHWDDY